MEQLCDIAKLSGTSLEQMLKEELTHIALSTASTQSSSPQPNPKPSSEQSPLSQKEPSDQESVSSSPRPSFVDSSDPAVVIGDPTQSTIDVNPPSIQRVVVEHVVRNSEGPSHLSTPGRLRAFTGKCPRPSNEADYDTWRTSVEVLMKDPSVSDSHCTHRILDSLLPPASEMTKHLGPQAKPLAYLELLDSAYGAVEDGDELYARFMSTLQNDGEKPSAFCRGCMWH
ncbi:hypothetical protein D5F01_LYC02296 [Larimichthys crocea]|uniref:Paraneoplastic antigen Ma-like C-terminal domain-containing protein n=1 Tax=Larimichthys crocea TaxID=215358 RepID=A0A6G0J8F0_LARCR|nr:hypothetical protein D5F01_LYC02296 [Larimichthys crocea]